MKLRILFNPSCTIDYSTTAELVASLPLARICVQSSRYWPFSRQKRKEN